MRLKTVNTILCFILFSNILFLSGTLLGDLAIMRDGGQPANRVVRTSDTARWIVGLARQHPDPAVNGAFADKLENGEISVIVKHVNGGSMASIGLVGGIYVLTVDPYLIRTRPTREQSEEMFMVLSHEHQHYRQFLEVRTAEIRPLSDTQCTMFVLYEVDAYSKSCMDAIQYGWSGPWKEDFCSRTTAKIAEDLLQRLKLIVPECKGVWNFYAHRTFQ